MAMAYGHVYVAQVAFGAKDAQTVKAFLEAEAYRGPSLIIAYSHCIAHGYDMAQGLEHSGWRPTPATGRSTGSIRGAPTPAAAAGARLAGAEGRRRRAHGARNPLPAHRPAGSRRTTKPLVERARHQIAKRTTLYRGLARKQGT